MGTPEVIDAFEHCAQRTGDSMHQWYVTAWLLPHDLHRARCLWCGQTGRFTRRELERWAIEVEKRRVATRRRTPRRGRDGAD